MRAPSCAGQHRPPLAPLPTRKCPPLAQKSRATADQATLGIDNSGSRNYARSERPVKPPTQTRITRGVLVSLITTLDVLELAQQVEAEPPRDILTKGNPKTDKGVKYGYLTGIVHLAPHKAAGFNVCAGATAGCIAACLNTAGRGSFDQGIQRARVRRTKWFRADRAAFMLQLEREILAFLRRAERLGLKPCIRLNGTSDLPWESIKATWADGSVSTIFDRFSWVQFYDYTKLANRFSKPLPSNYDLTFSAADGNERAVELAQRYGARVAVVFRNADRPTLPARHWELPSEYGGRLLVDADRHDLRFLDPAGAVCGLKAKGSAVHDTTGFVREISPRKAAA